MFVRSIYGWNWCIVPTHLPLGSCLQSSSKVLRGYCKVIVKLMRLLQSLCDYCKVCCKEELCRPICTKFRLLNFLPSPQPRYCKAELISCEEYFAILHSSWAGPFRRWSDSSHFLHMPTWQHSEILRLFESNYYSHWHKWPNYLICLLGLQSDNCLENVSNESQHYDFGKDAWSSDSVILVCQVLYLRDVCVTFWWEKWK